MIVIDELVYPEFDNNYLSSFEVDGLTWISSEQYYQASKFADHTQYMYIHSLTDPSLIYSEGRSAAHRKIDNWTDRRFELMYEANIAKIRQNTTLATKLKNTSGEIRYVSHSDVFWGCGTLTRKGENMLGKVLMKVREQL